MSKDEKIVEKNDINNRLSKIETDREKEQKAKETGEYISAIGYAILTLWILYIAFTL